MGRGTAGKRADCPEPVEGLLSSFDGAPEEKAGLRQAQPKREVEGGSSLRFAGYAAIFDRPDRGGDIIRPGAFARTLAEGRHIPLLWQHERAHVIGRIETLEEDGRGLRVIARVDNSNVAAKVGRGSGLSFGYRVRQGRGGTLRELIDLDLIEVSAVTVPMQPHARVHAIEPPRGGEGD